MTISEPIPLIPKYLDFNKILDKLHKGNHFRNSWTLKVKNTTIMTNGSIRHRNGI